MNIRKFKKGDLLIKEGESSDTLYWLQSGSLRLFKKKGKGFVELGVIHSGELVGEMSFMDHEPRSASVEAIQDCEVVEIPRGKFDEVVEGLPKWLNSLVHTLVKRLRQTNKTVRELSSDNTIYTKDSDGRNTKEHVFLHHHDQFKLFTGLLLAGTRHGEKFDDGSIMVRAGWLQIFANQILSAPLAKVTTFTEILTDAGVIDVKKEDNKVDIIIKNIGFLEEYVLWLNEENLKAADKQINLTPRAMMILDAIYAYGGIFDIQEEQAKLDIEAINQTIIKEIGRDAALDYGSFQELVNNGMASDLTVDGDGGKHSTVQLKLFKRVYPFLNLRQRFEDVNAMKRTGNPQ